MIIPLQFKRAKNFCCAPDYSSIDGKIDMFMVYSNK